ncbi:carbohydrate ABC transporter permease [Subtercola boreus]|uniref:Sugar ABC transporter permease n=1 Tax=Subtercola boreus TaxID=120213 RepID=A0A3E0WF69_9MICO|nr:sugar ABC transporter permease [Subtercola boreus]RFA22761.1 sugar ABC transporter permease [Subtercola boreus]RFA23116.1 sugar ABC transporter permease [Subtercola boreus]RFA28869.1 sugar ABC transporter permease [Subtercola boreus]
MSTASASATASIPGSVSAAAPSATARTVASSGRGGRRRRLWRANLAGYAFLTPNLVLLGLFVLFPLVSAVVISFEKTNGFGSGTFAGLDNYARLATDPVFWRSTFNTALFTALVTPLSMLLGLGAAVLLNSVLPARGLFRSILILPMAISGVATALIGVLVFDQNNGILDKLLRFAGLQTIPWQSGGAAAFTSVVLVTLWWRVGFNMLIYLAGLQSISPELYEAARLDGAGGWQRFRFLTVPLVGPSSFFLLIMNVIYSFQVFDIVFVLTGGGPQNATSVLVTYAYNNGFVTRDQGYAAAIGVVLLLITLVFTAVQWRASRTRDLVD